MGIELKDLSFSYGKRKVLKKINFSLEPGTFLCILGPNGVGKSTLFHCILGFEERYEGDIYIDKQPLKKLKREEIAQKIAYIPQDYSNVFPYTALDVVLMGTTVRLGRFGVPRQEDIKVAKEAMKKLEISYLEDRIVTQMSGGEVQLVLIARALAQQAKILIMDEPTSSLDYGNQTRVMRQTAKLAKEGYIIIQSTHNPEHVFLYAEKVLVLYEGKVKTFGHPNEVLTREVLEEIYQIDLHLYDIDEEKTKVCIPVRK